MVRTHLSAALLVVLVAGLALVAASCGPDPAEEAAARRAAEAKLRRLILPMESLEVTFDFADPKAPDWPYAVPYNPYASAAEKAVASVVGRYGEALKRGETRAVMWTRYADGGSVEAILFEEAQEADDATLALAMFEPPEGVMRTLREGPVVVVLRSPTSAADPVYVAGTEYIALVLQKPPFRAKPE